MKDEILINIDNASQLEKLYRSDKPAFKQAFKALYPELKNNSLAGFWNERLSFAKEEIIWGSQSDLVFVIVASLIAGLIAKLPALLSLDPEAFYLRNIGFIILPALSVYFIWKTKLPAKKIVFIAVAIIAGLVFINTFPFVKKSDTLILSCIHLPLFLWSITGYAFVGEAGNNAGKRLGYLKYNGDLLIITMLIAIAGGIVTAVTINLFKLIGFSIENFYFDYIVVFGLPAAPLIGTCLISINPQLVGRISPVIAKIFSPVVLAMLVVYLIAIIYAGKNPYNDREFLLIFNALLVGVMAIIFFSVAEQNGPTKSPVQTLVLLLLSVVTIIVNGIALSAILFRISEGGFTPNRAAVLGSNLLILINLLLVTIQLYRVLLKKRSINAVGNTVVAYLPLYVLWTIVVTFLFPLLFGFK